MNRWHASSLSGLASLIALGLALGASQPAAPTADSAYPQDIQAILKAHCFSCHGPEKPKAGLDLTRLQTPTEFRAAHDIWKEAIDLIDRGAMPPAKQPALGKMDRERLLSWLRERIARQVADSAGEPGIVPLRRLTQGEYERTIAAITGVAIPVKRYLPNDLVGAEGFGNAAAMQTLTSGHLERYLRAAEQVAAHARLLPHRGLVFETTPASPDSGTQLAAYVKDIEAIYGSALRQGEKDGNPFDLGSALWVQWQAARAEKADFAARCRQAKVHPGHARMIGEELARPTQSAWVQQLLLDPWHALLADRTLPPEQAEQRCRALAAGLSRLLTASFERGSIVPFAAADREITFSAASPDFRTSIFAPYFTNHRRLSEAVVEQDGKHALRVHLVLTDAGTRVPGLTATLFVPRGWAAVRDHETGQELPRRNGAKNVEEATLSVPGAYVVDHPLTAEEVAGIRTAMRDGKLPGNATVTGIIKSPFRLVPRFTNPAGGMQVLANLIPIEDAQGKPVVKAPGRGQVLPGQPRGHLGNLNQSLGSPCFAGPSEAAADTVAALDELLDRFLPDHYYHQQLRVYGTPYRSRADRIGQGPEVLYARRSAFDAWLTRHILTPEQTARLDERWLDLFAASREPWRRLDRLLGQYPALAEAAPEQRVARLAPLPPLPLVRLGNWSKRPAPAAARWREAETMITTIEAAQEQRAMPDVLAFAARAWRRPMAEAERESLKRTYRESRTRGLDPEDAARTVLASILISPHFLFRVEPAPAGAVAQAVNEHALAVRLSYLLWASPPDDLLRQAADQGKLGSKGGLRDQLRRMLRDRRSEAFVDEFFGQWLQFRNYHQGLQIDTTRYPAFTPAVQDLLHAQLQRQMLDLIQEDRPVTDLIEGSTFPISPYLVRYYGIPLDQVRWLADKSGKLPALPASDDELHDPKSKAPRFTGLALADLSQTDRRGLWGLGAMLVLSSKPLRTDPIHRANLIHTRLLGRRMPAPPDDAGMLPEDDKIGDGLSVRQRLVAHRRRADCVACHQKFDHFGFALERYDAIGRLRDKDAEGVAIDDAITVAGDEAKYQGPLGLSAYLGKHRDEFLRTFCRKLLAYALGRDPLPGDEPLIADMLAAGAKNNHRFTAYVEPLLRSRQFHQRHGRDTVALPGE
ncbi:MAG: DUF1592 domain-containing protein [Planctomycetia bacterium]|nr:DUF1592 domain-containing protein [Planctomycetia bacterium]